MKLENKIALITGGASGIGEAASRLFAREGASVIIWDMSEEKGKALAKELDGHFQQVNVADNSQVVVAVSELKSKHDRIDILINNAGITKDASFKKMTHEQWQQVIDVNLTGVFNCTKAIAPIMEENAYGRIINTSSVVGLYGNFGQTNYVATKSGVIGMTKVWAREMGRKGITANAVAPGFIATDMVKAMPQNIIDTMQSKIPIGRLGDPKDIANAYLFLASEEAGFVNGAVISVDGGMTV